jgi:hypothetical protein
MSSTALDKLLEVLTANPAVADGVADSPREVDPRHDLTDPRNATHPVAV